jgi:hypothetical protein
MTSTKKATVSQVQFGSITVEGLQLPDGTFAIAVTQANQLLEFAAHPNNIVRSVKRILGEDFQPIQSTLSELNPNKVTSQLTVRYL